MDLSKVLQQLRQDLENIDIAIASLERLENSGRGRGRPPVPAPATTESKAPATPKRRGRRPKRPESRK